MKRFLQFPYTVFSNRLFLLCSLIMAIFNPALADKPGDDKTLSPYFFVKSENPEVDKLPLKSTSAEVNIAGVIADVVVKQVYVNSGKTALEAIYIFPGSTRAAVYAMRMSIGERILTAKIEEREKARKDYEQAKEQGKTASLLEQQRPNVFQMNVANIQPGDTITVELKYTELLVPEKGIYEFVYPTVVGPRYSNQPVALASSSDLWVENPYLKEGEKPTYQFDIKTSIRAGMPVKDIVSSSHQVKVNFTGKNTANILLNHEEKDGGNRDYILKYRLSGNAVESGVLLFKGEKENFFLAMLQPPQRVTPEQIPGREYIFIVDISGSMYGFPLDISKKLLKDLIGSLKPTDCFNVMLFAGSNSMLAEQSLPATKENINEAIRVIEKQRGGGSTELLPALRNALAIKKPENFSRTFVIVTDGYVTVEKEAFDLIRNNIGDANFFTIGIGSSVNRHLIEGMSRVGHGESFVVTNGNEAPKMAERFREYVQSPVLTNVKADYGKFNVYDIEPAGIPDVLAERPVLVFGKWKGEPTGAIKIKGITGNKPWEATLDVSQALVSSDNSALQYLWARHRIMMLDDYNNLGRSDALVKEVTQLGLDYNLLTAYTSFIAIDSIVRGDGKVVQVKQPLPLPQGVSDNAVSNYQSYGTSGQSYGGMMYNLRSATDSRMDKKKEMDFLSVDMELNEISEPIFMTVETMPEFPGGETKMLEFLKNNLRYPAEAKEKNIEGTVYVTFIVDEKGNITDVKITKGVSKILDDEALRVVKNMPKWKPGNQRGVPVKVQMMVPVRFKLS